MYRRVFFMVFFVNVFFHNTACLFAQDKEFTQYAESWKRIETLEKKGLYRSALHIVDSIAKIAEDKNEQAVRIKATIYQLKLHEPTNENAFLNAVQQIDSLQTSNSVPFVQILASIKAEMLWRYLQQNRYSVYSRSQIPSPDLDDPTTWDVKTLLQQTTLSFAQSLENSALLQSIDLRDFAYILTESENQNWDSAPTLFDFLVHRALNVFQHPETSIWRGKETFLLKDEDYFGDDKQFLSIQINTKDTITELFQYVKYMQELARFHQNDKNPTAKVRNTLLRLDFARKNAIRPLHAPTTTQMYENALLKLKKQYENHAVVGEINAQLAQLYIELNRRKVATQHNDTLLIVAHHLCTETIEHFPNTPGEQQCKWWKTQIEEQKIDGKMEAFATPQQAILAQVTFKNVTQMYVSIYRREPQKKQASIETKINQNNRIRTQQISLPPTSDFQEHSTEIVIKGLPIGHYTIVFSLDSNKISPKTDTFTHFDLQITNLAYSQGDLGKNQYGILISDRNTGLPISKATVKATLQTQNKGQNKHIETYTSDENGWITIRPQRHAYITNMEIAKGKDVLDKSLYLYYRDTLKNIDFSDYLFSDRAIYRPGQTLYFKGIRLKYTSNTPEIVAHARMEVTLHNANYKEIAKLYLTSNEYGSFSGSFPLPEQGLTGTFFLQTNNNGFIQFSVEEYKLPTFTVTFNPINNAYQLGDSIRMKGSANGYMGKAIDGAIVHYVVKKVETKMHRPYAQPYFLNGGEIVEQGTSKTDLYGQFNIEFFTQNEQKSDQNTAYAYQIEVQVTDINGETQSANKQLIFHQHDRTLNTQTLPQIEKVQNMELSVSVRNVDGQPLKTKGHIIVSRLEPKQQVTRERLWTVPDLPTISPADFASLFPYLEFQPLKNEERRITKTVQKISFEIEKDSVFVFQTKKYTVGEYKIETVVYDRDNQSISQTRFVKINDGALKKTPFSDILYAYSNKSKVQPGDTVKIHIGTALENQRVLMEVNLDGTIIDHRHLRLNQEQQTITLIVEQKHRGGFSVLFSAVRYGVPISIPIYFSVPHFDKELNVRFETFRSVLSPGASEEWKLLVSGQEKEKTIAELLLTMYDASLDAFQKHHFNFSPYRMNASFNQRIARTFSIAPTRRNQRYSQNLFTGLSTDSPQLNTFGWNMQLSNFAFDYGYIREESYKTPRKLSLRSKMMDGAEISASQSAQSTVDDVSDMDTIESDWNPEAIEQSHDLRLQAEAFQREKKAEIIPLRQNFNETAFFYPHILTDSAGVATVKFTVPESLTQWKILGIAHNKRRQYTSFSNELITQKEVMIQVNTPRFVRMNDQLILTAKVSNLTQDDLNGIAQLELITASDQRIVNADFSLTEKEQTVSIKGRQSAVIQWNLTIPSINDLLLVRVRIRAGQHTDGEEKWLPILSDKMLVTESMPISTTEKGEHLFVFDQLTNEQLSKTITPHAVTFEYSTDPIVYVIQALPYLLQGENESSQSIFMRYYSNSIALHLLRSFPRIEMMIRKWQGSSPEMLLSQLEQNQELKTLVLEETPWVLEAESETAQKQRLALLLDAVNRNDDLSEQIHKLAKMQLSDGGFSWFEGMKSNEYITQHIVSGLGHLEVLKAVDLQNNNELLAMITRAVHYLDKCILNAYQEGKKTVEKSEYTWGAVSYGYFYARSFFGQIPMSPQVKEAFSFFKQQIEQQISKTLIDLSLQKRVMIALALYRYGDTTLAKNIMQSIVEMSIVSADRGMFWTNTQHNFWWNEDGVETQSLIIEGLHTILKDNKSVNLAKIHLLAQKHTTSWHNHHATANACFALFLGENPLEKSAGKMKIQVGTARVFEDLNGENFLDGYFKKRWTNPDIRSDLGTVKIEQFADKLTYGALYWQYFEEMDKVRSQGSNLRLKKQIFVVKQSDSGEELVTIHPNDSVRVGDKIRVRLELSSDRNLDFVHLKDMRASGFEPVSTLSQNKWQDGRMYYENPRDVAMHFFFDRLPKGTFVLEYDLWVQWGGNFSSGVAEIECMYAPEYRSHVQGGRVKSVNTFSRSH